MKKLIIFVSVYALGAICGFAQKPVAHWSFDNIRVEKQKAELVRGETYVPKEIFAYVKESVSGKEFDLNGVYYKEVSGVEGNAVLFDGYTAYIEVTGEENIPLINDDFTVETWLALGAYPKHHCPIFDNRRAEEDGYYNGFSLEIDANGRVFLKLATKGRYEIAITSDPIPLNTWTHIAGTYSKENGLSVYIDGKLMANNLVEDEFTPASRDWHITSMIIGKSRSKTRPYGTIRPEGTEESFTFIDGIFDELKLYNSALSQKQIETTYKKQKPTEAPELPDRMLPSGPKSPGKFRAVNTTLKYYEAWDAPWLIDKNADVVVQFDEADCKFVFWHGTSYIPSWVTENDIWFNNGFNEGWNENGSCEPMSDKKAKYSNVKIIESNDARVVVKWRYGLVDVLGKFAFEDPVTGWGDWTNETYTIYPDMVGVREDKLLSNAPNAAHEWQESMMVLAPGQRPSDVLNYEALSLANIKGEAKTYSWEHDLPPHLPPYPENPVAQVINTKSEFRPFSIIRPQDNPGIDTYSGEIRRDVDVFPWWNHWPVAPRPTDGRYAQFEDRAAHASISHWWWDAYKTTDRSMTKLMLTGMTDKTVAELIPLTKSWSNPAEIQVKQPNSMAEYKPEERAYHIILDENKENLDVVLKGSENSPVINPAFVIENWGDNEVELKINGVVVNRSEDFRYGFRESLESTDLIVWLRLEAKEEMTFSLTSK
jgi:hypothetical protein